ncbi:MAG TPA: thioredoxin family protein, partial [Chitinophagaceae bacterium]|nr:thioredoxin family protein [Chitinophagaceae bacterium]
MKNILYIAVMVCIVVTGCAHSVTPSSTSVINAQIKNSSGSTILAGHCSLSIFGEEPYKEWFDKSYNSYTLDTSAIHILQSHLQGKTIEVFLGSWCGDSKREVPRLVKILQAASFDTVKLRLIFVDNSLAKYKQSPQHEEAGKTIHHVPTIIVYGNGREEGRIIETPVVSLEKDLLSIVTNKRYSPNYTDVAWWMRKVKKRGELLNGAAIDAISNKIKPLCTSTRDFNAYGYVMLAQKNYNEAL